MQRLNNMYLSDIVRIIESSQKSGHELRNIKISDLDMKQFTEYRRIVTKSKDESLKDDMSLYKFKCLAKFILSICRYRWPKDLKLCECSLSVAENTYNKMSDYDKRLVIYNCFMGMHPVDMIKELNLDRNTIEGDLYRLFYSIAHSNYYKRINNLGGTYKDNDKDADINIDYDLFHLRELNMPTRVYNILVRNGATGTDFFKNKSREDLMNIDGIGKKNLDIIIERLKSFGIAI